MDAVSFVLFVLVGLLILVALVGVAKDVPRAIDEDQKRKQTGL